MFDGPQRAIRDAVQALGIEVRAGSHTGKWESEAITSAGSRCISARA
jgi:hypothetical protein